MRTVATLFLISSFLLGGVVIIMPNQAASSPGEGTSRTACDRKDLSRELQLLEVLIARELEKEENLLAILKNRKDSPEKTASQIVVQAQKPALPSQSAPPRSPGHTSDPVLLLDMLQEALSSGRMDDAEWLSGLIANQKSGVFSLLKNLLQGEANSLLKLQVLKILSKMKLADSVPLLHSVLLNEKSIFLWREALNALLSIQSPEEEDDSFDDLLIQVLDMESSDVLIREQIAELLAESGSPQAMEALSDLALNDKEHSVRLKALQALGKKNDPSLIPLFEEALWNDPLFRNKRAAILAFVYMEDPGVIPILESFLALVDDPLHRNYLEKAIEKILFTCQ